MTPRPLPQSLMLVAITIAAGIAVRFVHLGLPQFVVKYAGSMLWAVAIYWVVSTLFGRIKLARAAGIAASVAAAVEFFKLYRAPSMDAFRGTLPGVLLLGRYFSLQDIAAYWVAIAATATADRWIRTQR